MVLDETSRRGQAMTLDELSRTCFEIDMWAATNRRELGGPIDFNLVQAVTNMAKQQWWQQHGEERKK